MIVFLDQES